MSLSTTDFSLPVEVASLEPIEEMMDSRSLPSHAAISTSDEACAMHGLKQYKMYISLNSLHGPCKYTLNSISGPLAIQSNSIIESNRTGPSVHATDRTLQNFLAHRWLHYCT